MLRRCAWVGCFIAMGCGGTVSSSSTSSGSASSSSSASSSGTPISDDAGPTTSSSTSGSTDPDECRNGCPNGTTCVHPDGTIFGRCVARIAAGGACDSYCEACGSPAQCAEDLVCREKKCQTPLTEGQTGCVPYRYVSLCAQGLFCLVDTCRKPGKVGDDCVSARDIVACEDGLFCPTTTKKCETIVYGNPGDPCDNGPRRCKTGKCSVDDYPYGASQVTPGVCP